MRITTRKSKFLWSRKIESRWDQVEALCRDLRARLNAKGLEGDCFALELVARECLNNAIIHGNKGDPSKRVVFNVLCSKQQIRLQVADQGAGFDWQTALHRRLAGPRAITGRGLRIVSSYADRVRFNRRGNQITLWLRRLNETPTNCKYA